jgi:predicted transcriptional regulator
MMLKVCAVGADGDASEAIMKKQKKPSARDSIKAERNSSRSVARIISGLEEYQLLEIKAGLADADNGRVVDHREIKAKAMKRRRTK